MMTKAQIVTFVIIARVYYARYSAVVVGFDIANDPAFSYHRERLIFANLIIKRLKCYDPEAENNCLTWDQAWTLIQNLMSILGICGDPYTLSGSDTNCCNPIYGLTILNP